MRGRGWGAVAGCLVLVGCWKDNPAWIEGLEGSSDGSGAVSTGVVATSRADASSGATAEGSTTGSVVESSGEPGGSSGAPATTSTGDSGDSGLSGSSSGDAETTTGEPPPPVCGAAGFGEAKMLGRSYVGGIPMPCGDIPGRHFRFLAVDGDLLVAQPCSPDPMIGCDMCGLSPLLKFGLSTPEPAGTLPTMPCVYLSAHDLEPTEPDQPCRFRQMAVWWDGTNTPAKSPPKVILGHGTVAVDPAVAAVTGQGLVVAPVQSGAACSCVDADDCCPESAIEYRLAFTAADMIELAPGESSPLTFAGAAYDAYNGRSQETGACAPEQQFDWWLWIP